MVDLLIDRHDGIVNLCEMKYSVGPYELKKDESDMMQNRLRAYRDAVGPRRSVHLTMVTTFGLVHNVHWNQVQSEVTLDDLFAEAN